MMNVLPDLFYLSFFAIVILRLAVAFVFLTDALSLWKMGAQNKGFAIGWFVLGIMIGVGFMTQVASLIAVLHILYLSSYNKSSVFSNRLLALVTIAILGYLFVSGAGGLAFDLPY